MRAIRNDTCRLTHLLALLVSVLALSACGGMGTSTPAAVVTMRPSEPAATASPSPTLTETPTSTPTVTPTAGPSPTPAPTPSFPAWSGNTLLIGDLLFERSTPECELPCWQNLIIGKSGPEEIQNKFDTVFGFNGTQDFFTNSLRADYSWMLGKDGGVYLTAMLDESTMKLSDLLIGWSWSAEPFAVDLNPAWVIRELGTPTYTLVSFGTVADIIAEADYMMVYEKGLVFLFYSSRLKRAPEAKSVMYCLDNPEKPGGADLGRIVITEPLVNGLDKLSPFQMSTFGSLIAGRRLIPAEDVFGITGEEITQKVLQGNVCLPATIR